MVAARWLECNDKAFHKWNLECQFIPIFKKLGVTDEEMKELNDIREFAGKGYIRDYVIKLIHICPKCDEGHSWKGKTGETGLTHKCGHRVTWEEFFKLKRRELWMEI